MINWAPICLREIVFVKSLLSQAGNQAKPCVETKGRCNMQTGQCIYCLDLRCNRVLEIPAVSFRFRVEGNAAYLTQTICARPACARFSPLRFAPSGLCGASSCSLGAVNPHFSR